MRIFLITFVTALLILVELLVGNFGLSLAFPLCGTVYFAVAYRKRDGLITAAVAGLLLDAVYCRNIMLLMLIYPAVTLAAWQVARRFRRQMPAAPLAAGAAIGILMNVINAVLCLLYGTLPPGPDFFSMLVFQVFVMAVFMLVFALISDALAFKCNLPRFKMSGAASREERNE